MAHAHMTWHTHRHVHTHTHIHAIPTPTHPSPPICIYRTQKEVSHTKHTMQLAYCSPPPQWQMQKPCCFCIYHAQHTCGEPPLHLTSTRSTCICWCTATPPIPCTLHTFFAGVLIAPHILSPYVADTCFAMFTLLRPLVLVVYCIAGAVSFVQACTACVCCLR